MIGKQHPRSSGRKRTGRGIQGLLLRHPLLGLLALMTGGSLLALLAVGLAAAAVAVPAAWLLGWASSCSFNMGAPPLTPF